VSLRTFVSAAGVLVAVGCGAPTAEPTTSATVPRHTPDSRVQPRQADVPEDVRSPIEVRIEAPEGVPRTDQPLSLRWVVEQRGQLGIPLELEVRVPPGVRVSGEVSAHLQPNPGVRRGDITLEFPSIPAEDFVVVVHGASATAGYHAEIPYRFGRPTPVAPTPPRTGPRLQLGGHDLGRAVPTQAERR
jgi:hypothetical protein